jgi:hypothetical protein
MRRRMKGARGTAGDTGDSRVAMNARVRVYPGTDGEIRGTVVEVSAIWRGKQWISVIV